MSIHILSSNAMLAAALTPQKQKARSARAVRASGGRKALRDPRLRIGVFKKSLRLRVVHVQVGAHCIDEESKVKKILLTT